MSSIYPNKGKLAPRTLFSLILVGLLFFSIVLTQFATRQSRDGRSQAAGATNHTVSWPDPIRFRSRICLANTNTCQPFKSSTTNTYDNWTVASLVNYDLHVDITHNNGSNWYGWENQEDRGKDCFGPTTCTMRFSWAQVDFIVRTTLDNADHAVRRPTTSYQYTNINPNQSYSGNVGYRDFDNFGSLRTFANLGGTTGPCSINCPPPLPTVNIKADGLNGPINIAYNGSAQISWTSTNATECTVSPSNWTGTSNPGRSTGSLTANRTYSATCSNSTGSGSDSVAINVGAAPPPPPPPPTPPPGNPPGNPPPGNPPGNPPPPANPPGNPPPSSPPPSTGGCVIFCSPPPPPPPLVPPPVNPSGPRLTPPGQTPQTTSSADITLTFAANSYLKGGMEVIVSIDSTGVSQKIVVDSKGGSFILKPGTLTKGVSYKLRVSSKNSLIYTASFGYTDNLSLNIPELVTGDFNNDNQVNQTDLDKLLDDGFSSQESLYDINYDSVVNSVDYSLLLLNLGKVGS